MYTLHKNFELMNSVQENDQKIRNNNLKQQNSHNKSENTMSMGSEKQANDSDISAISSEFKEEKNRDFYEYKSQYLSDDIFFSKLNKKIFNNASPLIKDAQTSVNREITDTKSDISSSSSIFASLDFLKYGSVQTTVILLIVSTIGGGF